MSEELENLIRSTPGLWRGDGFGKAVFDAIPTGYPELDRVLPGQGWPRGAVIELLLDAIGIGELRLMLPAIRALIAQQRFLVMIEPPYRPCAGALSSFGLDLDALFVVVPGSPANARWAAEKSLLNPRCGMVLLWCGGIDRNHHGFLKDAEIRRLQVAAQASRAILVFYRIATRHSMQRKNPWAAVRLRLTGQDGALLVEVLKARGSFAHARVCLKIEEYF